MLWPAVMSAFNSYFDKKMNVMLNVCHTFISAFNMAVPALATLSMDTFGFRYVNGFITDIFNGFVCFVSGVQ